MSPTFDYSPYATTYRQRPEYVPEAIDALLRTAGVRPGDRACDIGAGSGHLTEPLLRFGLRVDAVEPTPAMRATGELRTAGLPGVTWYFGTGEDSGRPPGHYRLVTFGSSFDRTDRAAALRETARILEPGGSFACLWNHRDLTDPLQERIEQLIHRHVPGYGYGIRRTDQSEVIESSGLFAAPEKFEGRQVHRLRTEAWLDAWASHATVGAQAGAGFPQLLSDIRELVRSEAGDEIDVPYVTRIWIARRKHGGTGW